MINAGRVLSRTMIVENVWDQSFEGLTNIVDVYIAQLRKKIDEKHERKLLRTVRGVGYSIRGGRGVKPPRSIRVKLITLYVSLLSLVFVASARISTSGFQQFLVRFAEADAAAARRPDRLEHPGRVAGAGARPTSRVKSRRAMPRS